MLILYKLQYLSILLQRAQLLFSTIYISNIGLIILLNQFKLFLIKMILFRL
ncbi:hypothetical protein RhiirA1_23166 [Rhizophagus irregularis]|uniref:Uncharacterized protein n=1 Tax=Rhizophagus irregularis TaxID=588596 RepID=A0A2N0RAG6_9GLOM|nr:hypothetical protein RhiirA1_23166 [Rhizophagus irregularis]GET62983.1 hypothetical protein RIR_e48103_A0A2N0RAG6_9GLOM [Rhizophagus irregularis DAOM 181602=DAOM 197198]